MMVAGRCRSFVLLDSDGGTNPPILGGHNAELFRGPRRAMMIQGGLKRISSGDGDLCVGSEIFGFSSWKMAAKTKGLHFYSCSVYIWLLSAVWMFSPNLLGFQNEWCSVWAALPRQTVSPYHKWGIWLIGQQEHQSSLLSGLHLLLCQEQTPPWP